MEAIGGEEEDSENAEQQSTELEMLQSIYTSPELTVLKHLVGYYLLLV